jgi:hypothetical protein
MLIAHGFIWHARSGLELSKNAAAKLFVINSFWIVGCPLASGSRIQSLKCLGTAIVVE